MHTQLEPTLVNEPSLLARDSAVAKSGVSWGAIFAGATAAAALSLILLILGTGLGLASVSPWAQEGISAESFGVSTILWITFTSLAASGLGGYIAGRLRTRWVGILSDEVYFRDTAHGFLAWCVATLLTASLLTSVIGTLVGGTVSAGSQIAGGASAVAALTVSTKADSNNSAQGAMQNNPTDYFIDSLFRRQASTGATAAEPSVDQTTTDPMSEAENQTPVDSAPAPTPAPQPTASVAGQSDDQQQLANSSAEVSAEVTRIFAYALWNKQELDANDVSYVAQLVAARTGLSQYDAEQRVKDTFTRLREQLDQAAVTAKEAAEKAREVSAYSSLWLFVSLLVGAFIASLSATFGGRQRDL